MQAGYRRGPPTLRSAKRTLGSGPERVVTGLIIVQVVGPAQFPGGYVKTLVVPINATCAEMHWTARDIFDVPEEGSYHTELRMMPSNVILDEGFTLLDTDIDLSDGSPSPTCRRATMGAAPARSATPPRRRGVASRR